MSAIVTEHLSKNYGNRRGVEALNLRVDSGTLFGFLGPNGAGKTTTIRLLLALLRPTAGSASIFGMDCWRDSQRIKADVGYVPGDLRLYSWMNSRSALSIVSKVRGNDLMGAGLEMADRLDLDVDVVVGKMSRGMRQKLGLILALAHNPKLLILDEPTSALDPLMQQLLYKELRARTSDGATVFFSSHTLSEVEALCDQVAILRKGVLVARESLESLRTRARRCVILRWQKGKAPDPSSLPDDLELHALRGDEWELSMNGSVMEFVRWSSDQPLADLTIEQPDLEHVFQKFYEEDGPE